MRFDSSSSFRCSSGDRSAGLRHESDLLLIIGIPLQPSGRDVQRAFRKILDDQFPRRVCLQLSIADHADVDFTAFDVLLGNRVVVRLPMNELDALGEFRVVGHDRCLRDSDRTFFDNRFHEQRKLHAAAA